MNTAALKIAFPADDRAVAATLAAAESSRRLVRTFADVFLNPAPRPIPAGRVVRARRHQQKAMERGTVEQAMAILGLPKRTIQQKAQRNEIPGAAKIFGRWTFDLVQLRNFVRNRQCENRKPRPEPIGVTTSSGAKRRLRVNSTDGLYTRTIRKLRKSSTKKIGNDY